MCCGTPTTLYGTTTLTSSYTTKTTATTTIPPYASYSTHITSYCVTSSSSQCVSSTTQTQIAIFDHFFPETKTTTITSIVPVTTTKTYPTHTVSTPCPYKRDSDVLEGFEKRGAGSTINVGTKWGIAAVAVLLSTLLI
ncbi:hypothetical protein M408DRAFT_177756 [Serendipita vermifera MAFF 305830]|uniref:Uncharacterized protein n=1 Tax=Serendipita vermifera MAFF 305830 TaxID=933852 RepID=A0A0C2WKC3_SERVB|nr:hypothetical protein M408DRAFT_177756 [Serendipita vermifera MAFF 305830]